MRTILHIFGRSFSIKTTGQGLKNLTNEIRKGLDKEYSVTADSVGFEESLQNVLTGRG